MRHLIAAILAASLAAAAPAVGQESSHDQPQPPRQKWSFAGPFGTYDQAQLQRGYKVYKEVCSLCHAMSLVSFRNLGDPGALGYSEAQIKALASEFEYPADPNDQNPDKPRKGRPADRFPPPTTKIPNATPPDLSVIAKARTFESGFPRFIFDAFTQYQEQGVDYISAFLTGYEENPPPDITLAPGTYYNKYFPGHAVAMPKPAQLFSNLVVYDDGTPTTPEQYAKDVAAFLMWAAEPHLIERKRTGFQVMIFLVVLAGLLYFTKKKVWSDVHGHA